MKLTLHGETINVELGQEVTFYKYILNNDKVEFKEDKVVVEAIKNDFGDNNATMVAFRNESHGATFLHYEMGDFYISISDKNVLDFLTRKYKLYQKREEHLKSDMEILVKQIEELNNNKTKIEILMENVKSKGNNMTSMDLMYALIIDKLNIKIDSIEDRRLSQLKFYLLQYFGFDLGYSYNWYADVIYSPDLEEFLYSNIEYLKTIKLDSLPEKYQLNNESKLIMDKINKLFDSVPKEHFNRFSYLISLMLHISKKYNYNLIDNKNEIKAKFKEMNIDNLAFDAVYSYIKESNLI